jgi:large subunit ribosomal protein L9
MEVILLEKINNLGDLGKKVKVKPGYGRNYLIPNRKAVAANEANLAKFEAQRGELEKAQKDSLGKAVARAEALGKVSISIARRAGEEGKLYGSVGNADIAEAVTASGEELAKNEVRLPDGPFRALGEYQVEVHLYADVNATVTLMVVAEEEEK